MATTINLDMDQGADFIYLFQISANGVNLTNATPYATMMTEYDNPNTAVNFTAALAGSNLTITMAANVTGNLTPQTWVYDVVVKDHTANLVTRCVQGRIRVRPQVTPTP
jgi:hypothetical protein